MKTLCHQTIEGFKSFEHELPILLAWPCNNHFSAPNSDVLVCLVSLHQAHELGFDITNAGVTLTVVGIAKKKKGKENFHAVQWLGLHTSTARGPG